ncbi:MAG: S41 family peptidase [bacterium]|nr:S41 family peptidase [bacterium]
MQKHLPHAGSTRRSILLGIGIGLAMGGIFAGGFFFRDLVEGLTPTATGAVPSGEYTLLREVQTLLDRHYLREQPAMAQREYAAVRGMLTALGDPYTFFIDPPVAASESDTLAGTYGGIGVQVQRNASGDLLLYPFPDSPAERAGIAEGDSLESINGVPVDPRTAGEALDQMLRGEVREGSGVELSGRRAQNGEPFQVFVPFDVINVPSVVWRVLPDGDALGYMQVLRFTARTPDELRQGLTELADAGIEALVLDLRNNTGGLLQESISVADEFIDQGIVVIERDNQSERPYQAAAGGAFIELPIAVLVNDRTASGAELVAGALQDLERAILIGQPTFGKGTVQQIFPLSDASSLHVTSAEWLTPNRQALNANGLQPDIAVAPDASGRDVELQAAVDYFSTSAQPESTGS